MASSVALSSPGISTVAVDPNQLELPLLPKARAPDGDKAILDRIAIPARSRKDDLVSAFKKTAPWALGVGGVVTALMAAVAGGDKSMVNDALWVGGAIATGGTVLFTAADVLIPASERSEASGRAQDEAAKTVADVIRETRDQPWSALVRSVTAKTDFSQHAVKIDIDPVAYIKMTLEERAALPQQIVASLAPSVRELAAHIEIRVEGFGNAKDMALPSKGPTALGVSVMTPVIGAVGAFGGSIAGGLAAFVASGAAWCGIQLFAGAYASMFLDASACNAVSDFAGTVFQYGVQGISLFGAGLGALAAPVAMDSELISEYRSQKAKFRTEASTLLASVIDGCRNLLPSEWQERIGAVSVGKDESGYAIIDVRKNGQHDARANDEAALKAAISAILPKEMQRVLKDVPLYYNREPAEPKQPTAIDRLVSLGQKIKNVF